MRQQMIEELGELVRDINRMALRLESAEDAHVMADTSVEMAALLLKLRADFMKPRPRPSYVGAHR